MANHAPCRSCVGTGHKYIDTRYGTKTVDCRACNGTGINYRLYLSSCERCHTDLIYSVDAEHPPRYCKSCREEMKREKEAQWRETRCSSCYTTIKYNVNWDRIPDLCPACREKKKREREAAQAKWRTKSCKNCGGEIKYNVDWARVPDLCKSCLEKEKAKWREKSCQKCGATFKYNVDWTNIPSLCKDCREKEKKAREERRGLQQKSIQWDDNQALPGSNRLISDMRSTGLVTGANVKKNSYGGYHVTIFTGCNGERYSYDTDGDGNFVNKSAHHTDKAAVLLGKDTVGENPTCRNRW